MHVECLMCYTCGSVDHSFPFLEALTDLKKSSFITSILSSSVRLHCTDTMVYTNLVICRFSMNSVVCSCDGTRPE